MSLPRCRPADVDLDPRAVADFLTACLDAGVELHSVMVLRHGQVVAEGWADPYRPEHRQLVYSLSKTFASATAMPTGPSATTRRWPTSSPTRSTSTSATRPGRFACATCWRWRRATPAT